MRVYTIHTENFQKSLSISLRSVQETAKMLLQLYQVRCSTVGFYFVSRPRIQSLHKKHFSDPSATDCITLPLNDPFEEEEWLGEVFICAAVAQHYAREHGVDPYQELTLYMVHGFLHLMGFDDQTPEEKNSMRKEENACMALLAKHHLGICADDADATNTKYEK